MIETPSVAQTLDTNVVELTTPARDALPFAFCSLLGKRERSGSETLEEISTQSKAPTINLAISDDGLVAIRLADTGSTPEDTSHYE